MKTMIVCLYCREVFCCRLSHREHLNEKHSEGDPLADPCEFCGAPIYRGDLSVCLSDGSSVVAAEGVKNINSPGTGTLVQDERGRLVAPKPGPVLHAACVPAWAQGVASDIAVKSRQEGFEKEPWD